MRGSGKETRRVLRSLSVIVVVFACSWYFALLGADIGTYLPDSVRDLWLSFLVNTIILDF